MKFLLRGTVILSICILASVNKVIAQLPVSFKNLTIENGLSQNSVVSITQDKARFLWFGTRQGLNRYDGYRFKIYRNSADDPESLSNNEVVSLLTDSKGTLWVGTLNGLDKYDQKKDKFTRINIDPANRKKNIIVECIYEDRDHNLWVGSSYGLHLLTSRENNSFKSFRFDLKPNSPVNAIRAIFSDIHRNIWIGTTEGLLCMAKRNGRYQYKRFRHNAKKSNSISSDYITSINADARGNLWIGTNDGLCLYDYSTESFTSYRHNYKDPNSLIHSDIRDITNDHKGLLWIGTQEGLSILDPVSRKFNNCQHNSEVESSISHNSVHSIFEDVNKTMWIGTYYGGVNFTYPIATKFNVYRHSNLKPSISGNVISCLVEDEQRNLWIGTEGGGLSYWDRKKDVYRSFKTNPGDPNSISSNLIKVICKENSGSGDLIIGTHYGGLNLFNPSTGHFRRILNVKDSTNAIGTAEIVALSQDQYGTVWVGSRNGLSILKKQNGKFPPRTSKSVLDKYIRGENRGIQVLFIDRENQLWIGTSAGLFCYSIATRKLSLFQQNKLNNNRLKSDNINCIIETSRGQLCIGTSLGGLSVLDKQTNKFKTYLESDGLANNNVVGIIEDKSGSLWVSTANGLSKLDLKTGLIRNYTQSDGLAGNEFNARSFLMSRRGEVLFGGFKGLTSFYPQQIETNDDVAPIIFTGLKLFNQPVDVNGSDELLKEQIQNIRALTFKHNQNNFTIEFALLSYIKSDKNKYAYKLQGYEKAWNFVNHPNATYTNLPAGEYKFIVKGFNNDGIAGSNSSIMTIHILPPVWATWWAYLVYFLIFSIILFLLVRYLFIRALLIRSEDIHQMKLDFFTHVSHEIRTPLTLILGPLENLINSTKSLPEVNNHVLPIKNNVDRLIRLTTELIDFRKNETGKLKLVVGCYNIIEFADEIFSSFKHVATTRNIHYIYEHDASNIELYFDRGQLEKVLFNLLSNAFKFTNDGGSIRLSIVETHQSVGIKVRDNGKGIPYKSQDKLFSEFFQVDAHDSSHIGSGIGLALCKGIVSAHHGTIDIESIPATCEKPGDTIFTVRLKKGKTHFRASEIKTSMPPEVKSTIYKPAVPVASFLQREDVKGVNKETILIVEDNSEIRQMLRSLIGIDYIIKESADGLEGWETAVELLPDLIICDVMMPVMDGLELCKKLKTDERTSHIPIILLTAKSSYIHQLDGMETGADSYVTKPFSIDLLKLNVRNLLQSRANMRQRFSKEVNLQPHNLTVSTLDHTFIVKVIKCIEERMADTEFGVPELSAQVGMSQPVLYKKIRAITDLSVNDFIKSIRLKKAALLLIQKEHQVSEVSYLVGFNDPKYFSREFKKQYGQTPKTFRSTMNNNNSHDLLQIEFGPQ